MNNQYIPENSRFLNLFPHRWDFLFAEHYKPGDKPVWQSESRYPLSDRIIQQGAKLYGVRFGAETSYFMLDIDRGSPYHPKRDRFAVGKICEALELLGITDHIGCTSSYSEGIHLYFPLPEAVRTWHLAAVVTRCLNYKGFICDAGLLEVLPNERNFDLEDGKPSLFKGHRLPLQSGSYLLNEFWELDNFSSEDEFCRRWAYCERRNQINWPVFNRALKDATCNYKRLGFKASKFLEDLNTEIEFGWSGHGQTNYLLGRITLRSYVFGHCLNGGEPLEGERLVRDIVETATRLPGYREYCRHQHEIWGRAEDWARCVENSKYYHFGHRFKKDEQPEQPPVNWRDWRNNWLKQRAQERIAFAIADLLNQERLPSTILERFNILVDEYGFSGETLYRPYHLGLWHPRFIGAVENPPAPPNSLDSHEAACSREPQPQTAKSLLVDTARKPSDTKAQEWFSGWDFGANDRNSTPDNGFSDLSEILGWIQQQADRTDQGDGRS